MPAAADPDLALRLAKATADVYATATERLLEQVARRLASGIDRPGWQGAKLMELARLRDQARAVVERLEVLGPAAAERAIRDAYALGAQAATRDLTAIEVRATFGRTPTGAVEALVRETVTGLRSSHVQILRSTLDAYRTVIAEGSAADVVTGTRTRRQAAQRALDRFADRGITGFIDRAGRNWELSSYTEMATRTAAGRAHVQGTLDRYVGAGRDLVIISDAPQECRLCRPAEGKIYSISGTSTQYPPLSSATGLWHANCRHSASAYVEGLTRPLTNTSDPEGDDARQEQRRLERGVRSWKRRALVAMDDDTRRMANAHVRQWQSRLKAHVDAKGLKRRRERERLGAL